MSKNSMGMAVMLGLSMLFLTACGAQPNTDGAAPKQTETAGLGQFTAVDLAGNQVTQAVFAKSELTMVNIWATFCGPCLKEMPDLGELSAEYSGKGVQIIGIPIDTLERDNRISEKQVKVAKEIVAKTGANYLHILPSEDLIAAKLKNVNSVPETIFVDKNGMIVGKSYVGSRSKAEWQQIIEATLKEVR